MTQAHAIVCRQWSRAIAKSSVVNLRMHRQQKGFSRALRRLVVRKVPLKHLWMDRSHWCTNSSFFARLWCEWRLDRSVVTLSCVPRQHENQLSKSVILSLADWNPLLRHIAPGWTTACYMLTHDEREHALRLEAERGFFPDACAGGGHSFFVSSIRDTRIVSCRNCVAHTCPCCSSPCRRCAQLLCYRCVLTCMISTAAGLRATTALVQIQTNEQFASVDCEYCTNLTI